MKEQLGWFLKGMAMGAANVIPGVSGGTIAFITGIYQRLIEGIKGFDFKAIRYILVGDFLLFAKITDFRFLILVFGGIFVSILSLAKVLELAFEFYEILTLAFFFGLILASIFGVARQIKKWTPAVSALFLVGLLIAISIGFLPPAQSNENFFYILLCGTVAISSMILPGLSGSYILLLMGNYVLILQAISALNFGILIPMALGCVLGLVVFSRILSYLFNNFKDLTIALLTGFVAGSLIIIWPWKITKFQTLETGTEKAIGYEWLLPEVNMSLLIAVGLMAIGFGLVWWMDQKGRNRN